MIPEEEARGGFFNPALAGLSGLEVLELSLLRRGGVPPPIHHLTGLLPEDFGPGTATFRMPASEWLRSPAGVFLGGTLAIVGDAALGCAIMTELGPATPYTTQELSLNFLRPPTTDCGDLIARGRLIHLGRTLGLSEVMIEDSAGRALAHGTSRCYVFEPIRPAPPPPDEIETSAPTEYDTPDPYLRPAEGGVWSEDVWETMSGLEVLRGHIAGDLAPPPIHFLTGLRPVSAEEGGSTWAMPATRWLCSPTGFLQGGSLVLMADCALGNTIATTLPARTAYASLDVKVNFIRPVPPDGRDLIARGKVVHRGKSIAVADVEVKNADDKTVAVATGSAMILPGRRASLERPLPPEDGG